MNSFFTILKNYLKSVDLYGIPVQMKFNLKNNFQTKIGAILSIILYVFFLGILFYLYSDVHQKNNVNISRFETRFADPPAFNITTDELIHEKNLNDIGFFFYAIILRDKFTGQILSKEEIDKVLFLEVYSSERNKETGQSTVLGYYEFLPCNDLFAKVNLTEKFQNELVGKALCLNETINSIRGDFVSDFYRFMGFRLKSCSESILKLKPKCLPNSEFDKARQNWIIDILYTNYNIFANVHDKSPLAYTLSKVSAEFSNYIYPKFDMYLSKSNFISRDNLYIEGLNQFHENFVFLSKIVKQESPPNKKILFAFFLRSGYESVTYVRTYKTVLDLISQMGGIWKILLLIGGLIIVPFNIKLLKISIANRLYNIVCEDKRGEVTKTYTSYVKSSLIAEQNQIVKFENKTPLECKMAIDYYKYERNKGVNFDIKSFFYSMLKCEGRKNKSSMDLLKLSEETLMKELNFRNVLNFAKKISSLKNSLLKEKALMMFCNIKDVVSPNHLQIIDLQHELYTKINEADPVTLALFKEKFLLDGIRAMRNKVGGLDKKIDLELLDLLNINRIYLTKYFHKYIKMIKLKFENVNEAVLDMEDYEAKIEEGSSDKNN